MCGIAGVFNFRTGRPVDPDLLRRMCGLIAHRGPDWRGVWAEGPFGFGMVRLAIIGGSEADQPLWTRDGRLGIVFNGEIYNYQELNAAVGLSTTSDTRTLLELYAGAGPDCLARLAGMFALAIYDRTGQRLFLARDRFGKKPLFLAETRDGLAFASEIKPLLMLGEVDRELDMGSLSRFLSMGYMAGLRTPFRGVRPLAAATWREVGPGHDRSQAYFRLEEQAEDSRAAEEFADRFRTAVARRLVSDVPVGIFLSGGMDSNAILATALDLAPGSMARVYTIQTPGCANETATVRRTCAHFGLELEEVPVTPEYLRDELPGIVRKADNLLANPPLVALDALSARAAGKTKVVLAGSGGDEVFYGYPTWKADWMYRGFRFVPRALRNAGLSVLDRLPPDYGPHALTYALRQVLTCPGWDGEAAHAWWRTILAGRELAGLGAHWRDAWNDAYAEAFQDARGRFASPQRRTADADLAVWWRYMGLYQADVVPMGRGVELRAPFMDHELVQWSLRVPLRELYHPLRSKPFLKSRLRHLVPEWVVKARKCPFHIPLGQWMRGPLNGFVQGVLARDTLKRQGLLEPAAVGRLVQEHLDGRRDNSFKLFNLMVLTLWRDEVAGGIHA